MTTTRTGQVLNAAQTTYARKVETIIARIDPAEAPFPTLYIVSAHAAGLTPAECVAHGLELAL